MSDHIDRAAEVIDRHILPVAEGDPRIGDGKVIARALDAAGLLATPEHDAEVDRLREGIERMAREAERAVDAANPLSPLGRGLLMWQPDALRALLHAKADHIEREGGAS